MQLFSSPFETDIDSAPAKLQMELIDLQCDDAMIEILLFSCLTAGVLEATCPPNTKVSLPGGQCQADSRSIRLYLLL